MKTSKRIVVPSRLAASIMMAALTAVLIAVYSLSQATPALQESVQKGAYLARAGDCVACHTAPKGKPFAGGLPFVTPQGVINSTNITPDLDTGIGRYSRDDFVVAVCEGVAKDKHRLYPAMPYTSYARLSQEDLSALYTYFMRGIEPVRHPNRPTKLSWPYSMRSLMAVWNALYFKRGEYAADLNQSASWNRGAYLVQGLGHCGGCHTPQGAFGHEKAASEKDGGQYLAGATLENWHASPLTGDRGVGLFAWKKEDIVEYLKTGRTARVAASGMMALVIAMSTQYLTDQDLKAIADYLKTLQTSHNEGRDLAEAAMQANAAAAATRLLRAGDTGMRGARIYLDNCNACHRSDGSGAERTFPNLAKNEAVNAKDPVSLIHIVLTGGAMPSTQTAPSAFAMPEFGWRLTDGDAADVISFIRGNWGNQAAAVSSDEVGRIRKALAAEKAMQ